MQTAEQVALRSKIEGVIGHPILVPSPSRSSRTASDADHRFDPYANPEMSESPSSLLKREIATRTSETITKGLLELFTEGSEALPTCKPFVRAFISTRMANVGMAAELPCGSWGCHKCGPKLKLKWYLRHVNYIADVEFLERIYIEKDEWQAMHRMINRQGEKYLKYEQHDGSLLLLTTARLGGQEVKLEDREFELVKALIGTAFCKQPVSQSRNWVDATGNEATEDSNWLPLDSLRYQSLDAVMKALFEMGIESSPHSIYSRTFGSMRAATFRIPTERFWDTLWGLGAMTRRDKEKRETEWIHGPPNS